MAVAFIAFQKLTPPVRAEVNRLIRLNPSFDAFTADLPDDAAHQAERELHAFMLSATWPDLIKRDGLHVADGPNGGDRPPPGPEASQNVGYSDNRMHKYWHFKDVAFSPDSTPLQDPPDVNIEERLVLFSKFLSAPAPAGMSPADFDRLKSYDLVWLLHLAGDVHQPLHCTSRFTSAQTSGDAGGNFVKVHCQHCPGKLHAFWDDALGTSRDVDDAITLAQNLNPADPKAGNQLAPDAWVAESFALAKSKVYISPVKIGAGPFTLNSSYIKKADALAAQRVALAGLRLGNLLNQIIH